ncbi:hypothetical protein QYE76_053529 [Lolium multiflorum]|uniref:Uncharacterized protein n=1 Tax=Lolium multiflorum TaxID=4521 RepID=A0AAD8SXD1_LOLMU|nr:hypothetical protein QYE76_053529 [Lolium multiflorum]
MSTAHAHPHQLHTHPPVSLPKPENAKALSLPKLESGKASAAQEPRYGERRRRSLSTGNGDGASAAEEPRVRLVEDALAYDRASRTLRSGNFPDNHHHLLPAGTIGRVDLNLPFRSALVLPRTNHPDLSHGEGGGGGVDGGDGGGGMRAGGVGGLAGPAVAEELLGEAERHLLKAGVESAVVVFPTELLGAAAGELAQAPSSRSKKPASHSCSRT